MAKKIILSEEQKAKVTDIYRSGGTYKKIGEYLSCSEPTAWRILNELDLIPKEGKEKPMTQKEREDFIYQWTLIRVMLGKKIEVDKDMGINLR